MTPHRPPLPSTAPPSASLDEFVRGQLSGGWGRRFVSELFQGSGQLALMLLLLELVAEWPRVGSNPDPWLLLAVAVGQSAWLARQPGVCNLWWSRLVGLIAYVAVECSVEGLRFFSAPHHVSFVLLSLLYALGMAWERRTDRRVRALAGTVCARLAQASGPMLYYVALDVHGGGWWDVLDGLLSSPAHLFLLVLALAQTASLVVLSRSASQQSRVIEHLVLQLKDLSRWGYGDRVVDTVLRQGQPQGAVRAERHVAFIDVRGFTPWSESHSPEEVVDMLNAFYAAVREGAGAAVLKTKMSGDEVMLVCAVNADPVSTVVRALAHARQALAAWGLDAGAGLWQGPVVEGFFGARDAQVHDVIGDTVNTASRLCGQAAAGQLLWGPAPTGASLAPGDIVIRVGVKGKTRDLPAVVRSVASA